MSFDMLLSGDPLILVLASFYVFLALASPKAALFVVMPVMALAPEVQVGGLGLRPEDPMLAVLAIAWGIRRLARPRDSTALDRPLVAYLIVGILATLWGAVIGTADLWSLDKFSASGFHLLKRVLFVLYFFILTDSVRSIEDVRKVTYGFIVSLIALTLFSLRRYGDTGYIALAPAGAAIHEPGLAAMLTVAMGLGLWTGAKRFATSAVGAVISLGALWALPFSLGRNFLLSTVAMVSLVAVTRKRALLLLAPLAAILAPVIFPGHVLARILSVQWAFSPDIPDPSVGAGVFVPSRIGPGIWYILQMLGSSPLFGWGLGSVPLGSVDSEYAAQLVATGILGFGAFVWLLVRIVRITRETPQTASEQRSPSLPLALGLQYCLVGYALYSLFSPSISAARAGAFFFTIIGLLAALHRSLNRPLPEGH